MQLVEQHVIDRNDNRYEAIDRAAFASKNVYNAANYLIRQSYIQTGVWLRYESAYHLMKEHEAYQALPAKVAQQVIKVLDKNWKGHFEAVKAYDLDPSTFLGHPKLPKYKDKQQGRNVLVYTIQAISKNRMEHLTNKRTRKIDHYLHTASKRIVDVLVHKHIGTLVIGKNVNWKQEANMGKRTNQNFVQVPHARFIDMLTYKCKLVGIRVVITEERYTSKCSFRDMEPIGKHEQYLGKRVKRGLFRSADGTMLT